MKGCPSLFIPFLRLSAPRSHGVVDGRINFSYRLVARRPAFSLVELLAAMAAFSLLLLLLVQALNVTIQATHTQNKQMDSVASARRAIDVINTDLHYAVISENATILAPSTSGHSLFACLTTRRGPTGVTGQRYFAVSYATNGNDQLIRSYGSIDFSQTNLLASAVSTPSTAGEPLATGILAIQAQALADGTNSYQVNASPTANWATNNYNGITPPSGYQAIITRSPAFAASLSNRTHAFQIWVVVADTADYQLLQNSGKLTALKNTLALSTDPTTWRTTIDASSIPSQAKSGIRVLTRTIPLP